MNRVVLMGRLTRDPEIRYSNGENALAIARFTLAVDRRFNRRNDQTADFITCKAFGKQAEFAERFLHQGIKVAASGRIETGSYTNRDGQKVYTTEVILDEIEFAESKAANEAARGSMGGGYQSAPAPAPMPAPMGAAGNGFMNIPDGIDEELPFN